MTRLLVIDDSPTIRKLVELSFRQGPLQVEFAINGVEGLKRAASTPPPDVVLLDCVLPDMKAVEACQRLSQLHRHAPPRIILMSAKERSSLQDVLDRFPEVVDFLGKPFNSDEVRARVQAAASLPRGNQVGATPSAESVDASRPKASPAPPSTASPTSGDTEAAAKAIFAHLARPLGSVPEWLRQLGPGAAASSIAPTLARKLLTPELVATLLEALAPYVHARSATRPEKAASGPVQLADGTDPSAGVQGRTKGWSLASVLRATQSEERSGELLLVVGEQHLVTYWDAGEMVLCSCHDPAEYLIEAPLNLLGVEAEARQAAEAEQRQSATPVYVTLADRGALPPGYDFPSLLFERSTRLLRTVLPAASVRFTWHDLPSLPTYVQSFGRALPLDGEAQVAEPGASPVAPTLSQLALERLRKPSSWPPLGLPAPEAHDCYERAAGFSGKLRLLRPTATEQRVLTLIDRQSPLRVIAARSGLALREVARIVSRLEAIELVKVVGPGLPPSAPQPSARNLSVMVLDPDVDGFCRPLRDRLARLPRPVPVFDLSEEEDLTQAILRERPGLVVLNESAAPGRLASIARAVREVPHLTSTALLAIVGPGADAADSLTAAGFDAVWSKPIHLPDLCSLLPPEVNARDGFSLRLPSSLTV